MECNGTIKKDNSRWCRTRRGSFASPLFYLISSSAGGAGGAGGGRIGGMLWR